MPEPCCQLLARTKGFIFFLIEMLGRFVSAGGGGGEGGDNLFPGTIFLHREMSVMKRRVPQIKSQRKCLKHGRGLV